MRVVLVAAALAVVAATQCKVDFESVPNAAGGIALPDPVSCTCAGGADQSATFFVRKNGGADPLEPATLFSLPASGDLGVNFPNNHLRNNEASPFTVNSNEATGQGVYHIGGGFFSRSNFFIRFSQPVTDLSLLVYDFKGDGGGFIGQGARLQGFQDDSWTQPVGSDRFWVLTGLPDGAAHRMTVCTDDDVLIRSASLIFDSPGDVGVGVDNVQWCCDNNCEACTPPDNEEPDDLPPNQGCPLDTEPQLLETIWEPVLDAEDSGFNSKDVISVHFDNPDAFRFVAATNGANQATETVINHGDPDEDVTANSLALGTPYTAPRECYTRYEVVSPWAEVVPSCARDETDAEVIFTCKTEVRNEQLAIGFVRGVVINREIISEFPWIVKFPKQIDVHLENLSVFDNPNEIAAIIYQSVDVNVGDLSVDARVKIFSSLQWPFKCDTASVVVASQTAGVAVAMESIEDCPDHAAGDVANSQPGDANACNQIWEIKLTPTDVCELDGDYSISCEAVCQDSWPSDCPLLQDDLGANDPTVSISYTLDSEDFCPQVVDNVDISASLTAYKDHAHTVSASNFVVGQTIYFKAAASSSKATIVQTGVDHLSIMLPAENDPNRMITLFDQGGNPACDPADNGDSGLVQSLLVEDGGCESGVNEEAWFQWLICENNAAGGCPFGPPVDGQQDFDVWVTLDITFKDVANNGALLDIAQLKTMKSRRRLLQGSRTSGAASSTATGTFGAQPASADEGDETVSSAGVLSAVVAIVLPLAMA